MPRYRVFANYSECHDIIVEAADEQEAKDIAYSYPLDEWDLFAVDFDGDEVRMID